MPNYCVTPHFVPVLSPETSNFAHEQPRAKEVLFPVTVPSSRAWRKILSGT